MKIQTDTFKTYCLGLLQKITKSGKLMDDSSCKPLFGFMQGSVIIKGDIVASIGEKWFADK